MPKTSNIYLYTRKALFFSFITIYINWINITTLNTITGEMAVSKAYWTNHVIYDCENFNHQRRKGLFTISLWRHMTVSVRTSTINDKRPFSLMKDFQRGARDGGRENFNHQRPNQITIYRNFKKKFSATVEQRTTSFQELVMVVERRDWPVGHSAPE